MPPIIPHVPIANVVGIKSIFYTYKLMKLCRVFHYLTSAFGGGFWLWSGLRALLIALITSLLIYVVALG